MITRRRFLVGLALPALAAGCGWQPLYANHETEPVNAQLRAIRVVPILERTGQRLEMALRNSLNPDNLPAHQIYALQVTVGTAMSDLGIQSQGLGTRGEVTVSATYKLSEIASNTQVQTGTIRANDAFDIQANGYSTVVAQDDAYKRCVEDIRREMVARLTLFLQDQKTVAAS
jgi:LPS-assembly lipoprotein